MAVDEDVKMAAAVEVRDPEKGGSHAQLHRHISKVDPHNENIGNHGHASYDLPDDAYVVTIKTWIVVVILSISYGVSFWIVPAISSIQNTIAAGFGDAAMATYFNTSYTIGGSVAWLIGGANSDLFGRRYFIIGGNIIVTVGYIVMGAAKNNSSMIAGFTLIGFGGGNCQLAAFALPELLPSELLSFHMPHRIC